MNHTFGIKFKSSQPCSKSWRSSLTFFSRSSIVLRFTFKFVYFFFQLAIITPRKPHWLWYSHCAKLVYHSSVQFSPSVVSDSLWTHELHHTRLPCLPPTPRAGSNSCPLSRWCHLILYCPLLLLPSIFPSIRVFSNESVLRISWPKHWLHLQH